MTVILIIFLLITVLALVVWIVRLKKSIKEHFKLTRDLQHEAGHDGLTGLVNTSLTVDRLTQLIRNAQRHKRKIAILYLEVDYYKQINSSSGFDISNGVLEVIAQKLLDVTDESDTVARVDGDEFVIILDNYLDSAALQSQINEIMDISKEILSIEHHKVSTVFNLGISRYPIDNVDALTLLSHASTAMQISKQSDEYWYKFYTYELGEEAFENEKLEHEIVASLENNEVEVYYQIQVDAKNDRVVGMEALARWRHPIMGLILPDKFLSLSQEIGFIGDIDKFVMQESIKQFRKWNKAGLNPGTLFLNLSILRLNQESFMDEMQAIIKDGEYKQDCLCFEISEREIMRCPKNSIEKLNELSALGIRFLIDDFGTDFSSLKHLKKLPVQKLKIDRSIIANLTENEDDKEIIKSIIAIAKKMNIEIIAEGVETRAQCDFLFDNLCSSIQGYLYHKPEPVDKVEKSLANLHASLSHEP